MAAGAVVLAGAPLAETLYDSVFQVIQKVFVGDVGRQLAEAMVDVSNADAELDRALTVAPRAALGEPIDTQSFEALQPDAEAVVGQIRVHLNRARKFSRNASGKIFGALENGAGVEPIPGEVLQFVRASGVEATTYADLFNEIAIRLTQLEEVLGNDDVGIALGNATVIRTQLIDLRALVIGASATN